LAGSLDVRTPAGAAALEAASTARRFVRACRFGPRRWPLSERRIVQKGPTRRGRTRRRLRACGSSRREWYPALEAAEIAKRGPYHLRHTFATEALAAGVSIFELARLMGTSVKMIDRTYGHLARDSETAIRTRLEARGAAGRQRRTGE
jgi:integrase